MPPISIWSTVFFTFKLYADCINVVIFIQSGRIYFSQIFLHCSLLSWAPSDNMYGPDDCNTLTSFGPLSLRSSVLSSRTILVKPVSDHVTPPLKTCSMASCFSPSGSQSPPNGLKATLNRPYSTLYFSSSPTSLSTKFQKKGLQVSSSHFSNTTKLLLSGPELLFHLTTTPFPQITARFVLTPSSCLCPNVTLQKRHSLTSRHPLLTLYPVLFFSYHCFILLLFSL